MNKSSAPTPEIKVREGTVALQAPLLDQLLRRGQRNLVDQGIDIAEPGRALQDWSRLTDMYNTIGQGIVDTGSEVSETVSWIAKANLPDTKELALTVNVLFSDLNEFTSKLLFVKKRHEGMSGVIKNSTENALYLSIGQDYSILAEQFKAMMFNAMLTITEYANLASSKLREDMAAQSGSSLTPEQDPNVVTDAVIKEESKNE